MRFQKVADEKFPFKKVT